MEQYISKSAIMAEIEDWRDKIKKGIFSIPLHGNDKAYATFEYEVLGKVRDLLDTFEVKEVDLEKEATEFVQTKEFVESKESPVLLIAKYFFELGLKAQERK